ncbi:MAG: ATP-binding protein [Prolixibacteraceae bacterium]|nr:ATP-binding protein [Prolixibacteraceae bacterium]MBN2774676.1 ATP-binding protein [Prolixibacteraceae bacterium]
MGKQSPHIFIITGAESTGKSLLTKQLADYFNVTYFPEFARDYILSLNRKYTLPDVELIAKKQKEQFLEAYNSNNKIFFFDTWLIITKVWFEVVFNQSPKWISEAIKNANITGFILNDIDIPWEPDPVRENGGESRIILHNLYIKNLKEFQFDYYINKGLGKIRFENAVKYIERKSG